MFRPSKREGGLQRRQAKAVLVVSRCSRAEILVPECRQHFDGSSGPNGVKSRGPLFQTNSLGVHRIALKFGSHDASRGVKDPVTFICLLSKL
jgi:hypothetical protein